MKPIILVDCNNFFVSCERLFNPKLINKPVGVLSNNDGCIISRSNEVKALGIPMGAAAFKYEHLIKKHKIELFSSNFTLYADISGRVMHTLSEFATDIEIYSIDEAFLNIPENPNYKNLDYYTQYCHYIRIQTKKRTGIPVSLGIGQTKTLAKIANKIAKKNPQYKGVFDITAVKNQDEILQNIDVADVWGVGYRYAKLLKNNDIFTAKDLKYASDQWVKKNMTVVGLRTVWELRGIQCYDLAYGPEAKQSITVSRSFGKTISSYDELSQAVAAYVIKASQKLREQKSLASNILIFVATNRYHDDHQYFNSTGLELNIPSNYTPDLLNEAQKCLKKIYRQGYLYKKAGVLLTGLIDESEAQLNLTINTPDLSKQNRLMKSYDKITKRWGNSSVTFAYTPKNKNVWISKRLKKSPHYTTNWYELLTIEI